MQILICSVETIYSSMVKMKLFVYIITLAANGTAIYKGVYTIVKGFKSALKDLSIHLLSTLSQSVAYVSEGRPPYISYILPRHIHLIFTTRTPNVWNN